MTWRNFTFSKLIGWFCRRDFCKTFPMEMVCVLVSFSNCYLWSLTWPTSRWYTYREWLNSHDTFRFRFGWDGFSPGEYWTVYTTISDSVCLIGCCVCPNSRRFVQTVTHILCVCFILVCVSFFFRFKSPRSIYYESNEISFCSEIVDLSILFWHNNNHSNELKSWGESTTHTRMFWAPSVHRQTPF